MPLIHSVIGLLLCLSLHACAAPHVRFDQRAQDFGLTRSVVSGTDFQHAVFTHITPRANEPLHVYINGDGIPWNARFFVANDPTPSRSLALDMLRRDQAPALMLGRPCYHGLLKPPCTADHWTSGRFSKRVLISMQAALRNLLTQHAVSSVVLIGHSGGGALAMLLAERVDEVTGVVTVAGVLDTDAWTTHHDYQPLFNSINPAQRPALDVRQLHFYGESDSNTPATIMRSAIERHPNAQLEILEGQDHICCWSLMWSELLEKVAKLY
ncbi:MAG: dienelactone hydrolase family protein [Pseudomonadota bacterium]